jgi:hypothetical protein
MSRLRQYRYVGTSDPMGEREAYQCDRYLKRHRQRMLVTGHYLIDTEALVTLFHLDCFNCRRVHRETCCDGQPYAVDTWQIPLLELEARSIAQRYMPERERGRIDQAGIWDQGKPTGTIRLNGNRCLFQTELDGRHGCSIHAHAEANGLSVYSLKPFSCQLYPLDLIQTGEQVLITALNEETAPFSRWGTDYLEQFLCASLDRRRQAKHLDSALFAEEGYRPAYQWGLPFLRHALGAAAEAVERELCAAWEKISE